MSVSTTVLALVGKMGATASFNAMFVFTTEIYPTEVRNIGLGTCSMAARLSGIMAPYVSGTMVSITDLIGVYIIHWVQVVACLCFIFRAMPGSLFHLVPNNTNKGWKYDLLGRGQKKKKGQ